MIYENFSFDKKKIREKQENVNIKCVKQAKENSSFYFSLYMYVSVCVCVYNINDSEEVHSMIFGCWCGQMKSITRSCIKCSTTLHWKRCLHVRRYILFYVYRYFSEYNSRTEVLFLSQIKCRDAAGCLKNNSFVKNNWIYCRKSIT